MPLRRILFVAAFALGLLPAPARADKLDKDSQKWLGEVSPLLLPEEEKTFRSLKEKADREEFQKIFWARRNPMGPAAAENPLKAELGKARIEADRRFRAPGKSGADTECGRLFILLGEPDEVKKQPMGENPGARPPENWTYKSRPGYNFRGGQLQVPFDSSCAAPIAEQLKSLAESKIASPNIGYRLGGDGRLTKLADLLPKPTPTQALLKEPRQDFPLSAQPKVIMRGKEGATYVGGLVQGDSSSLTVRDEAGKKKVTVVVAAQALDEGGKVVASSERETSPEVASDGSFLGSYGLTLKPGKYTLRAGALDAKSGKGSVSSASVEVPDFNAGELVISDLIVLADLLENQAQDVKDPTADFYLGTAKLVPRFGNVFTKGDAVQVISFIYNPQVDPATSKPSVAARFQILKDGKPVTRMSDEQVFDTVIAPPAIGPVPLERFAPGKYVVQLKVSDNVAKKDYTKEASFEVK